MKKQEKEDSLVGRTFCLDRSDQRTGLLLADQNDHLVLYDKQKKETMNQRIKWAKEVAIETIDIPEGNA